MIYRTLDGRYAGTTRNGLIDKDLLAIRKKCAVIENGTYRLYKIENMEQLVPLIYGRYKVKEYAFPLYLIENKSAKTIQILKTQTLFESVRQTIELSKN